MIIVTNSRIVLQKIRLDNDNVMIMIIHVVNNNNIDHDSKLIFIYGKNNNDNK